MSEPETDRKVKAVHNMFQITEILIEQDGAQVTYIADELDLAKSTVHQHLSTLCNEGYAVQESGEYQVGLKFLSIGEYARQRRKEYRLAKPLVRQLANETDERAQFFVEEHGRVFYLHTETGERAVQADRSPGELRYLHSSAGGKAILAHMEQKKVDEVIEKWGLPGETENTITNVDELYDKLAKIRERGYSINNEESISGLWAIGVPVIARGDVIGAFSVSGPRHRMETDWFHEKLPNLLLGTANELEIKIEYS